MSTISRKKSFKNGFIFVAVIFLIIAAALYLKRDNQDGISEGLENMAETSSKSSSKTTPGITDGRFNTCPNRDNCRSSDDERDKFYIEPIADTEGLLWAKIPEIMHSLPRVTRQEISEDYMYFTQSSAVFRFVDDIEFHRRPELGEIAVRSASRLGYRDFGVNLDRIEQIRKLLSEAE